MRRILVLVVGLATVVGRISFAQEADVAKLMAQSEPAIQEQIRKTYGALNRPGVAPEGNVEAFQEVQILKGMTSDKGEIVKQLAVFAATPTDDEQQPLVALAILDLLDLPSSIVVRTLAPYLNTDNRNLRSFVRDWFQGHDNAAAPGPGMPPLQPVN